MKRILLSLVAIATISLSSFGQTLERIAERRGEYGNYQYGFINDKGDTIVPIKYDFATKFVEGFSIVNVGCEWGVTFEEKAGQVIEKNVCLDGKWGYINYQGEEVIPLVFDKAYYFQENFALVHIGGTGGAAWSGSLEYVDSVAAARRINHGYTFINKEGDRITSVCYDEAGSFNEGLARVEYDGKCGFIDYSGKEIIPLIYDETSYFAEGKTKVSLNGREFYIDKNGNEISE